MRADFDDIVAQVAAASTKTFKCPECGGKVLEQTSYCVKCKKKVKQADDQTKTFKCSECGTGVLENTGYCVKCKKKVKKASEALRLISSDALLEELKGRGFKIVR